MVTILGMVTVPMIVNILLMMDIIVYWSYQYQVKEVVVVQHVVRHTLPCAQGLMILSVLIDCVLRKLHTHRCVRNDPGRDHTWGNRDQFRANFQRNRDQRPYSKYPGHRQGGDHAGGQVGGPNGRHIGRHDGGRADQGVGQAVTALRGHNRVWADPRDNMGFQDMTAQQNLLGALEQQLQQVLSRVIRQALTADVGTRPTWGPGGGFANPSS